eukprot:CAMPEP_0195629636 /NCGR_PEP_ID=MMETSP0815-20121206/20102_1 /TAXON_ID=97485 /ORGANISM="Prymnesium parvum, Strain Texoma1" /LENGTH=204 /DNA_ID=CAMNT_0040771013 /DNA_START=51 /DNA_END=663 /DNA_ORIENTATION=-
MSRRNPTKLIAHDNIYTAAAVAPGLLQGRGAYVACKAYNVPVRPGLPPRGMVRLQSEHCPTWQGWRSAMDKWQVVNYLAHSGAGWPEQFWVRVAAAPPRFAPGRKARCPSSGTALGHSSSKAIAAASSIFCALFARFDDGALLVLPVAQRMHGLTSSCAQRRMLRVCRAQANMLRLGDSEAHVVEQGPESDTVASNRFPSFHLW